MDVPFGLGYYEIPVYFWLHTPPLISSHLFINGTMRTLVCAALAFALATGIAAAKSELKFVSGSCDGTTWQWWSVQRFENGRLIETWGVDCNGNEYHSFGRAVTINEPLAGLPTETGACEDGDWYAVTSRVDGIQTDCWGKDCDGTFWHFEPEAPALSVLGNNTFGAIHVMRSVPVYFEQVPMHVEDVAGEGEAPPVGPGVGIQ